MESIIIHQAYNLKSICNNIDLQISAITANEKYLIIGTQQGYLVSQRISETADSVRGLDADHFNCKIEKSCTKKTIQHLEIIDQLNILVCLSDGYIFVYDLKVDSFLNLVQQISSTKGAILFSTNVIDPPKRTTDTQPIILLAVVIKRSLFVYKWENQKGFVEFTIPDPINNLPHKKIEIALKDTPKCLSWCQTSIFVGFRNEYVAYQLNGEKQDLFPTSSSRNSEPCIFRTDQYSVGLNREIKTNFVSHEIKFDMVKTISWADIPIAIIYDKPFYIGILISSNIEIQATDLPNQIQVFLSREPKKLRFMCRSGSGLIFLASNTKIWSLTRLDTLKQRDDLMKNKYYGLAVEMAEMSSEPEAEKLKKIQQIKTVYAYDLFRNKNYMQSMNQFKESDADPLMIIKLYPQLLDEKIDNFGLLESNDKLELDDYRNKLLALIDYLSVIRAQTKTESFKREKSKKCTSLMQIIDTTLLKCYLETNDCRIASLLRLKQCNLRESERVLKAYRKWNELIILYETRAQHNKALDLLKLHVNDPESVLKGFERIVQYLQNLGEDYLSLMFEYADWVLKQNADEGIRIFIDDFEEVENFPRAKVCEFIERNHSNLLCLYLEHIIDNWNEKDPLFHDKLIANYIESIKAGTEELAKQQEIRKKMRNFLLKSNNYSLKTALNLILANSDLQLLEEKAIVLDKLENYNEVLNIYLFAFKDHQRAIDYCNNVYEKHNNVFIELLQLMLSSMSSDIETYQTIAKILNSFAEKIPLKEALVILPDFFPLELLKQYLQITMNQLKSKQFTNMVKKSMKSAQELRVKKEKYVLSQNSIIITDLILCPVCNRKFTNQRQQDS